MADSVLHAPSLEQVVQRLQSAEVAYDGELRPVEDFVDRDRDEAHDRRAKNDENAVFRRFGAALLERAVTGASYNRRIEIFEGQLSCVNALTDDLAVAMLRESGYRWCKDGALTLMALRNVVQATGFSWDGYFCAAEEAWESSSEQDTMQSIKSVGYKTRDFALSEFSDYFCASDLHVRRLIARTGLLLHGYGDPDIATSSDVKDYQFLRRLVQKLAKKTGFPDGPNALSPAHIDRTLWYFGQGRCGAQPDCQDCPAKDLCLTGVHRNAYA